MSCLVGILRKRFSILHEISLHHVVGNCEKDFLLFVVVLAKNSVLTIFPTAPKYQITATKMTSNNNNILPETLSRGDESLDELILSDRCVEEDASDEFSVFSEFTLSLDEDDQCSVSVLDDDASFLQDDDDLSTGSCDEAYNTQVVIPDDVSHSTRTEIDTNPLVATKSVIQTEERHSLRPRSPMRQRRRGGRRPAKKPNTVSE